MTKKLFFPMDVYKNTWNFPNGSMLWDSEICDSVHHPVLCDIRIEDIKHVHCKYRLSAQLITWRCH